jgi:hypothetical protein
VSDLPPAQFNERIEPPIEFQKGTFETFILREPTAGEVLTSDEQLRNGATHFSLRQRQIFLIHRVSGLPVPVVQKLPISQVNRGWTYLQSFLERGLATGEI